MHWRESHLRPEPDGDEHERRAQPRRIENARVRDHVVEHERTTTLNALRLRRGEQERPQQCERDANG